MNLLLCIVLFNYCLIFLRSEDDQIIFDSAESKEIIKQIHRINNDGTYTVGYEADDGSFKIETRDVLGNIKGSFGYIDDKGTLKRVTYTTSGKRFNFTEEVNNGSNDISKITIMTPSSVKTMTTTTKTLLKNINTSTIKPLTKVVQLIPKRKTDQIISSAAAISATTNIPILFSTTTKNQFLSKVINHKDITTIHESPNSLKSHNQIYKNPMNLLQNSNDFDDVYNVQNTRPLFTTSKPIYNRAIELDRFHNNFVYYPSELSQLHETKFNQNKDFDEQISKIKPPVTTADFQLLLDYLLLRQDRLKQARKLFMSTTSVKNLLFQPNIEQTKQSVPIIDPEKIQQPTILMILPSSTTYNEGQKYLPILSTSRHNELSENHRQIALIQKRQLTGNYNGPEQQHQHQQQQQQQQQQQNHINIDEKGNHLLPFYVREMLLLRMLQLAINPDLSPLPYFDNDLIQNKQLDANNYNQYQNQKHQNHNQIRNLKIIQDNEEDETSQKNKFNFIRQNQYQNPIYMNY